LTLHYPEVVDKMALLVYWEWSIQKEPIKIVAVHIWTHLLSTCVTLRLLRNDIHKLQTSEGTHSTLPVQHWRVCNLQENADSCMGCM